MRYLLGIDFGGGASKATLLCENGEVISVDAEGKTSVIGEDRSIKAISDTSSGPIAMTPTKAYLIIPKE